MKRLAATALVVLWIALPVCAQHSSTRGNHPGHSARSFHGKSNATSHRRSHGSARYTRSKLISIPRRDKAIDADTVRVRSARTGSRRYRRAYQSSYGSGIAYVDFGGSIPYFLAYPGAIGEDDSPTPSNTAAEMNGQQYDEQAPPANSSRPAQIASVSSLGSPSVRPDLAAGDADTEDAVTLIFKDGRPPELIHNYILTRSTLYVGERHHPEIPVDELDLVATAKVNHDAGIPFDLPIARH
jgi:hypothetical protein